MWFQAVSVALGVWLLLSPATLPSTGAGATVARIIGPVVIWAGLLALRSVTRPFRALHLLSGVALNIATWAVAPNTVALAVSSALVGWALIALAIIPGRVSQRTGDGWWAIIQPPQVYGRRRTP